MAAETIRSAEMKAAANIVAVSRAAEKLANIGKTPCIVSVEPDHRADANINAGGVPIGKYHYVSVAERSIAQCYAVSFPFN
ncbi:MAG TPA: hypothetical protein VFK19_02690 [Sphingomicrobium sp.]|nr:hypothetical protein [Sphingomicrobium sp.]